MRRGKKFIIAAVLAVVVLGGTLGGVALAADNEDGTTPVSKIGTFLEKVIGIYEEKTGTTIDRTALDESITEARDQLRTEAREQLRQRLIDEGVMTGEEFDQWQEWLDARPDVPMPFGNGGMHSGRFGGPALRGFGGGLGNWCQPDATTD